MLDTTLGPVMRGWAEANLRLGEGDYFGQFIRYHPYQADFLDRWYEYHVDEEGAFARWAPNSPVVGHGRDVTITPSGAMLPEATYRG